MTLTKSADLISLNRDWKDPKKTALALMEDKVNSPSHL